MKETIRQVIQDFHAETWSAPFQREFNVVTVPTTIRKAHVLMGMRRSGKTWMLYQHIQQLLLKGITKKQILYINFEDDRLIGFSHLDFQLILDSYFELYPELIGSSELYFFFDEIHEVDGWEKFIRRLLDKEKMQIFITGSSAKMLSREIATSLRGRTFSYEIFPFSFSEYLSYKGISLTKNLSSKQKSAILHHLNHYLHFGGLPETLDQPESIFRQLLQGYIDTVIHRDIVERYRLSNTRIIKLLLIMSIKQAATSFSIQKVFRDFKSNGESIGKNSLYDYMAHFEDAYCVLQVPLYSHSIRKQVHTPKKIYPIDQGLLTAYSIKQQFDTGPLMESMVFAYLRRKQSEIFYYKTDSGKEVDFLTLSPEGEMALYQACFSMKDAATIEREESALWESMKELNLTHATIIVFDFDEVKTIKEGKYQIDYVPFALLDHSPKTAISNPAHSS